MDRDYTYELLPDRPTKRASYAGPIVVTLGALVMWLLIGAWAAFAQVSAEAGAAAGANAEANVSTRASAAGGGATINEQRQAPGLGSLALGGGNPCAYSPATGQISLIGGGAGIGGMKIDEACSLMVLGAASGDERAYKAAGLVIAGRNKEACVAMEKAGMVDCPSYGEEPVTASAKTPKARPDSINPGWGAKCELNGKKLAFQPTSVAARDSELQACKARFKLR